MIEIYGISTTGHKCPACDTIISELEKSEIQYIFKSVMRDAGTDLGFTYDRKMIDELRQRINQPKGALTLPHVFVNGAHIGGAKALIEYLDI